MQHLISFADLPKADLIIDAEYQGGDSKDAGSDPIDRLLKVGLQGGFRFKGSTKPFAVTRCILYSTLNDPAWPDELDPETGAFLYYGDNKHPGKELHPGSRHGNTILRECFERLHRGDRESIPPFFVFTKAGPGRNVVFRGLAVPGGASTSQTEDLVAIWKTKEGHRFQNYRSLFTILNVPVIKRAWIEHLYAGGDPTAGAPDAWVTWRKAGLYTALMASSVGRERSPVQQLPEDEDGLDFLRAIHSHCKQHRASFFSFEPVAAALVKLMDSNVGDLQLTRPWRDGGRDAIGIYRIGPPPSRIEVHFAMEAKCYELESSVGVRETSRLISRLRHRQFGVLVTTSFLNKPAYQELIEDGHPVIVLSGGDLVSILKRSGIATIPDLTRWLDSITREYDLPPV